MVIFDHFLIFFWIFLAGSCDIFRIPARPENISQEKKSRRNFMTLDSAEKSKKNQKCWKTVPGPFFGHFLVIFDHFFFGKFLSPCWVFSTFFWILSGKVTVEFPDTECVWKRLRSSLDWESFIHESIFDVSKNGFFYDFLMFLSPCWVFSIFFRILSGKVTVEFPDSECVWKRPKRSLDWESFIHESIFDVSKSGFFYDFVVFCWNFFAIKKKQNKFAIAIIHHK